MRAVAAGLRIAIVRWLAPLPEKGGFVQLRSRGKWDERNSRRDVRYSTGGPNGVKVARNPG